MTCLYSQATNELLTRVPKSTTSEMEAAVTSCKEAYKTWSRTTVLTRQQAMFKYQQLVKANLVCRFTKLVLLTVLL